MISKKVIITLLVVTFLPVLAVLADEKEPVANYYFVDLYGKGPLSVGDLVTAYDENGILCGKFMVETEGQYGFMHVYGDDPTTPDKDEGADPGSPISFKINGVNVTAIGPERPVWTGEFGDRINVNLR